MQIKRNSIRYATYIKKELLDWVKLHASNIQEPANRVLEEAIATLREKVEAEQKAKAE